MNEYRWEDLAEGMRAEFRATVSREMVDSFRALSGDINPLHADARYARSRGFESIVVHGMLIASFYSTLAGVYLPGRNCFLHGVDVQFAKPVFPGDDLHVRGEIAYLNHAMRQAEIRAAVINEAGVTVSKAKIRAGVF